MAEHEIPESEINALIKLIESEDAAHVGKLKDQFLKIVTADPDRVEQIVYNNFGSLPVFVQEALEVVRWKQLSHQLRAFAMKGDKAHLLEGLSLVSRFYYPKVKMEEVDKVISDIADLAFEDVRNAEDIYQMIRYLNKVLFVDLGFSPAMPSAIMPEFIFLIGVLKERIGTSLSLACLYLLIARKLKIASTMILMPGMALVRVETNDKEGLFIDPFMKGKVYTARQTKAITMARGVKWSDDFLTPVSDLQIIKRTVSNLVFYYNRSTKPEIAKPLKEYLEILENPFETPEDD